MPPPVCKFWQQGSCRFGDRCRFDHPPLNTGVPNSNRFAALQSPDSLNTRNNNNGYQAAASSESSLPYQLDKNAIITDLSTERPQWILSAYGPGRHAPAQLFGGLPREQSFEEMRLLHYAGIRSGNTQQVLQDADKLLQASEQQMQTALNNVDGAINFIISAEKEHPNRIDITKASSGGSGQNVFSQGNNSNPFQAAPAASNHFGTPSQPSMGSAFGAPSHPAISSTFGALTVPTARAFGQPSALGQKPNPFAAQSQPVPTSAFGAPSQLGATGAFGRPSVLGQKPNPFGAASGASSTSAAGFSAFASSPSPFSQAPQPATSSSFGAPSLPVQASTFGQPSGLSKPSPWGSSNQPSQPNPFSNNASSTPFGAPSPAPKNTFAASSSQQPAPNPLDGNTAPPPNAFGPGSVAAARLNPFGNPEPIQATTTNPFSSTPKDPILANTNIFGGNQQPAASSNPFNSGSRQYQPLQNADAGQHPSLTSYASVGPSGRLAMFKGKRVVYREKEAGVQNPDGTWEKIWFPEGPPRLSKDTEMDDSKYDAETKAAYMHLRQTGAFKEGVIPMVPPKQEWCLWDF